MYKIMSAQEAVGLIEDGDVIALNSFLGIDIPVELHCEFGVVLSSPCHFYFVLYCFIKFSLRYCRMGVQVHLVAPVEN